MHRGSSSISSHSSPRNIAVGLIKSLCTNAGIHPSIHEGLRQSLYDTTKLYQKTSLGHQRVNCRQRTKWLTDKTVAVSQLHSKTSLPMTQFATNPVFNLHNSYTFFLRMIHLKMNYHFCRTCTQPHLKISRTENQKIPTWVFFLLLGINYVYKLYLFTSNPCGEWIFTFVPTPGVLKIYDYHDGKS